MADWSNFFVAELGAAAALSGLVIVAISINVTRILSHPSLPGRAAETLVTPTGVLVASSYALVPDQPDWLLAGELILTGAVMWAIPTLIQIRAMRGTEQRIGPRHLLPRVALTQFSSIPFMATGGLMLAGIPGALYWIVPGVIVSLIATVLNAWVLLIEILR